MTRTLAFFALLAAGPALAETPPDPVATGFQRAATEILAQLQKSGASNVGVLKFLVRHGNGPARDDAGDLNMALANKLELALILANTDDRFGVLREPSAAVVRDNMASANHRDATGRQAFFRRKFDLSWTDAKATPGAFVVGLATVAQDLSSLTVTLQSFTKTGELTTLPGGFTAPADPRALADAGFSYILPMPMTEAIVAGNPPPRTEQITAAVQSAAKPDAPAESPITWTVLYNDKPVPVIDGRVAEPAVTDRVEFKLANPGPGTFAAVLMVNGENTLDRERSAPAACRKWVLPPQSEIIVSGFQQDDGTRIPFRVLPSEVSDANAVNYAAQAGSFRLVIYAGRVTDGAPDDTHDAAPAEREMLALARARGSAAPTGVKPQTLKALQAAIRGRADPAAGARGLVVGGTKAEASATKRTHFVPTTDLPIADTTLRYFTPKSEK